MDIDWSAASTGTYVIIECYRLWILPIMQVFIMILSSRDILARVKKQWGQNLIKFQGKTPGGIELNGNKSTKML